MINQLIQRRRKIVNSIEDNSIVILHSGYAPFKSADSCYDYHVNRNFYYLTGIEQEDVTLVLGNANGKPYEYLFIEESSEYHENWFGHLLTKEEASQCSGIEVKNIRYNGSFNQIMENHFQVLRYADQVANNLYLDLEKRNVPLYNTFALEYAAKIQKEHPAIVIKDIYPKVLELRMIKDEKEIELIKESISTTNNAILEVMKHSKELVNESVAEAYYDYINTKEGKDISFTSIIASGKNATVLHYSKNDSPIEKDSLLLMDVGCFTKNYSSDITRTFPANGKFTKRQKQVYEIVLDCNKKCIEYAKAGMSWQELNDYAKKILAEGCKKLGLIEKDEELFKYYYHSIGHSLGLDVHDPDLRNLGLLEGMVITIEPGLYIKEWGIGIRIEDNIQITCEKAKVLSQNIIKEIADIEAFFEKHN